MTIIELIYAVMTLLMFSRKETSDKLSHSLVEITPTFSMWANYVRFMTRRRFWVLPFKRFITHNTVGYGDETSGYILGQYIGGIFRPSHFAPVSDRAGYILVKNLAQHKMLTTVFAVTTDLSPMLLKAGFKKLPQFLANKLGNELITDLGGSDVVKEVFYNGTLRGVLETMLENGNVEFRTKRGHLDKLQDCYVASSVSDRKELLSEFHEFEPKPVVEDKECWFDNDKFVLESTKEGRFRY